MTLTVVFPPLSVPSFADTPTTGAKTSFTLVLDAGHGGKDPGALGKGKVREKNINLAVTLAVGKLVEQNMKDVKVVYTRKTDVFVELDERAHIANKAKADLFVSIHTNALPGTKQLAGSETYTLGMHRAADNLEVAKRENSVISLEKDYENRYEGFDPKSSESYIIFEFMQDLNMEKCSGRSSARCRRACASWTFAPRRAEKPRTWRLRCAPMTAENPCSLPMR